MDLLAANLRAKLLLGMATLLISGIGAFAALLGIRVIGPAADLHAETTHRVQADSLLDQRVTRLEFDNRQTSRATLILFKDWCRQTPLARRQDVGAVQSCLSALQGAPPS